MPQVPGRRRATMCDLPKSTSGTPARRTSRRRSGSCEAPESPPVKSALNQWGHGGSWNVGAENGTLESAPEKIVFRFHSRDLHMEVAAVKSEHNFFGCRFECAVLGAYVPRSAVSPLIQRRLHRWAFGSFEIG